MVVSLLGVSPPRFNNPTTVLARRCGKWTQWTRVVKNCFNPHPNLDPLWVFRGVCPSCPLCPKLTPPCHRLYKMVQKMGLGCEGLRWVLFILTGGGIKWMIFLLCPFCLACLAHTHPPVVTSMTSRLQKGKNFHREWLLKGFFTLYRFAVHAVHTHACCDQHDRQIAQR